MSNTPNARPSKPTGWVGWIAFAAILMTIAGMFSLLGGLAAVFSDKIYVTGPDGALLFDVTAWGWFHIVTGAAVLVTGLAVMMGQGWGRIVAVIILALNMTTQLMLLPYQPWWGLIIITMEAFAIYGLIVHGDEMERI